ncbi:hypothetical protein DPEC_G00376600 [Dallia pectoralis]|nr:hypothetical protein DPEC_G00376600 [Dallia pectoralis]
MSPLVGRIARLDDRLPGQPYQPWIHSQGGWDRFAEIFGKDAAANSRKSQESFKKWLLAGMTASYRSCRRVSVRSETPDPGDGNNNKDPPEAPELQAATR